MLVSLALSAIRRVSRALAAVVIAAFSLGTAQAQSIVQANYMTLHIPGVPGDFTTITNAPAGAIQVLAMSSGDAHSAANGSNTVSISLTKYVDSASPTLLVHTLSGGAYPSAQIIFWSSSTSTTGVISYAQSYTIFLTGVTVLSYNSSASGASIPTEILALAFQILGFTDVASGAMGCYNTLTGATSSTATTC
jgi:type VI protein secretion system component Hcp